MAVCYLFISLTGVCNSHRFETPGWYDVDYMDFLAPYLATVLVKTDRDLSAEP